jgi:hypothetical protein
LIIKRNEKIEEFLLQEIQKTLAGVREGIHMSDLLSLKKAYWQKTKPLPPLKREVIYWLSGQAHETVFLHVSNLKHCEAKEWNGIWYTPDAEFNIFQRKNLLTEMKTSRRGFMVKEGEEAEKYSHYLKQIRYYCTAENKLEAGLFVWYLVMMDESRRNTDPDFFFYTVDFTPEELEATKKEILINDKYLRYALEHKDPSALPDCEQWMCYREIRKMITKPKCLTCNKGNGREFETDWGIDKHINSKTGKDHKIVKAIYEKAREPRCKYAEFCNPDMYNEWLVFKHTHDNDDDFGKEDEL